MLLGFMSQYRRFSDWSFIAADYSLPSSFGGTFTGIS
jgi:hypothetical protein